MARHRPRQIPLRFDGGVEKMTTAEYNAKYARGSAGATRRPNKKLEAKLQAAIAELLQLHGWVVIRINSGAFKQAGEAEGGEKTHKEQKERYVRTYLIYGMTGTNGIKPASEGMTDLLALRGVSLLEGDVGRNEAMLVEVKKLGGKLRESQIRFAEFCGLRNVTIWTFDSWEEAYRVITKHFARNDGRRSDPLDRTGNRHSTDRNDTK